MASLLQSRLLHISVAVLSGVAAAFFLVSIPRPFTTGPLRSLPLSSQKHDRKAMGGSEEPSCVCDADAPVDRRASAGEFAGFKAILEDSSRNASEVRVRNKKGVVISVETPSSKGETQDLYIYIYLSSSIWRSHKPAAGAFQQWRARSRSRSILTYSRRCCHRAPFFGRAALLLATFSSFLLTSLHNTLRLRYCVVLLFHSRPGTDQFRQRVSIAQKSSGITIFWPLQG